MADPEASQAAYLAEATSARLYASGFALVPPSREPGLMMHAPFALLPQPVCSACGALLFEERT